MSNETSAALPAARAAVRKPKLARSFHRAQGAMMGYLFVAPALILFGVYYAYAIVRALWMSFTDFRFLQQETTTFVGLKNYAMALGDEMVVGGLVRAAYFTVLYFPGVILVPLVIALVLDRIRSSNLSALYRTLLYIPATIPGALVFRMWSYIYRPSYGLLNTLLVDTLHIFAERPQWLVQSNLVFPPLALMHWWWSIGSMTIFYLVALANISQEMYEAARLDGASEWSVIRYITLPMMRRTMLVWSLLNISIFSVAAEFMIMYGEFAAPRSASTWALYSLELLSMGRMPLGYATAIGWIGAIVMVLVAAAIYLVLGRRAMD